jgi:hypothetical protein
MAILTLVKPVMPTPEFLYHQQGMPAASPEKRASVPTAETVKFSRVLKSVMTETTSMTTPVVIAANWYKYPV